MRQHGGAMIAIERAAAMIAMVWADIGETTAEVLASNVVKALADAGLLVTDEIQAVLDAAIAWNALAGMEHPAATATFLALDDDLQGAVDAYLATRPS